jgi:3-oxoacyl-[acyl-carrier protein] reductase
MDLALADKRAIVTGGSKGIGRAIASCLVGEGCRVSICARTAKEVEEVVSRLSRDGGKAYGATLNVADKAGLEDWVRDSAERLGGIDIVVANVSALAIDNSEEAWRQGFEVDLMHTVRTVNAAMPFLEKSKTPSIVVISSVSGREIDFAAGPYGTMKAALIHYAAGLAYQLAGKGIRVNTVSPGNTYFEGGVWHSIKDNKPDLYKQALGLNPTGRMASPEEIARGVVFLASPASSFTTGTNLVIDGALTRGVQY